MIIHEGIFFVFDNHIISKLPSKHLYNQNQNRNTIKWCEICSKIAIKTPDPRQRRRSGIFIVNFEHIPHLFIVFLVLL